MWFYSASRCGGYPLQKRVGQWVGGCQRVGRGGAGGGGEGGGVSDVDSPNENLQMAARPEAMITARIAAGRRCR